MKGKLFAVGRIGCNLPTTLFRAVPLGQAGDKPVPADYDGDSKTDMVVFRGGS